MRLPRAALAVAVTALAATACAPSERPTLDEVADVGGAVGTPVGNAGVDQVLTLLETVGNRSFTAQYALTRRLGGSTTPATVSQGPAATSVTVGDVRFLENGADVTCQLSTAECEDGILDQRISDIGVPSAFWAEAPARALRVTFARRGGEPVASQQTVAGLSVECVDVPVGSGVERYCATPAGPIAIWDTADKLVELQGFSDTADEALFVTPGG
jgi:hypothetical protein